MWRQAEDLLNISVFVNSWPLKGSYQSGFDFLLRNDFNFTSGGPHAVFFYKQTGDVVPSWTSTLLKLKSKPGLQIQLRPSWIGLHRPTLREQVDMKWERWTQMTSMATGLLSTYLAYLDQHFKVSHSAPLSKERAREYMHKQTNLTLWQNKSLWQRKGEKKKPTVMLWWRPHSTQDWLIKNTQTSQGCLFLRPIWATLWGLGPWQSQAASAPLKMTSPLWGRTSCQHMWSSGQHTWAQLHYSHGENCGFV